MAASCASFLAQKRRTCPILKTSDKIALSLESAGQGKPALSSSKTPKSGLGHAPLDHRKRYWVSGGGRPAGPGRVRYADRCRSARVVDLAMEDRPYGRYGQRRPSLPASTPSRRARQAARGAENSAGICRVHIPGSKDFACRRRRRTECDEENPRSRSTGHPNSRRSVFPVKRPRPALAAGAGNEKGLFTVRPMRRGAFSPI